MRIGVPAEVKNHEYRVAITPAGVLELTQRGHEVVVETGAGLGSALTDDDFVAAGATLGTTADAWSSPTVLKVKEPIASEYHYLRDDLLLFTYLHLAADAALTDALLAAGTTAVAYETVQLADGSLPLLAPMSEVAGRLATLAGATHLLKPHGGSGLLLGGVPGVRPASVVVLGGGVAGANAVSQAVGLGADVTVLDVSVPRLRWFDDHYRGRVRTVVASAYEIDRAVTQADLVIGAVLVAGGRAPHLVSTAQVHRMRPGSVLVDIAIDQGGCFEDSRPTTHDEPTFTVGDSVLYCVANMPGAAAATSTVALTNATMPYVLAIADDGWETASAADASLAAGLNVATGSLTHPAVAAAFPDRPTSALGDVGVQ